MGHFKPEWTNGLIQNSMNCSEGCSYNVICSSTADQRTVQWRVVQLRAKFMEGVANETIQEVSGTCRSTEYQAVWLASRLKDAEALAVNQASLFRETCRPLPSTNTKQWKAIWHPPFVFYHRKISPLKAGSGKRFQKDDLTWIIKAHLDWWIYCSIFFLQFAPVGNRYHGYPMPGQGNGRIKETWKPWHKLCVEKKTVGPLSVRSSKIKENL